MAAPVRAQPDAALDARARAIHERVLTLDTHVDIPFNYATPAVDPCTATRLQVDIPKMERGGLNAAFFIVFVGQAARTPGNYARAQADALTRLRAIRRVTSELCPDRIALAETPDEVERIRRGGRLVAAIGIENGFAIGRDIALLERYYLLGARYLTLVHNGHNDIADSAQPRAHEPRAEHGGLSAFGEQVVAELNRLGMMIDVSHSSKEAMLHVLRVSRAPVIASHSSTMALARVRRNIDDQQLLALQRNGGVIQVVAVGAFLRRPSPTVADFVDHIDHVVQLIGIEHVGISSDFDGGGGVTGWRNAAETLNVTRELVRRGYAEEDIARLWGGNLLRVWRAVERVAAELRGAGTAARPDR